MNCHIDKTEEELKTLFFVGSTIEQEITHAGYKSDKLGWEQEEKKSKIHIQGKRSAV